jgi:hypothetical protein
MWPDGTDPTYRDVYSRPHRLATRMEIWERTGDTFAKLMDLPFAGGAVQATLGLRVVRTMTVVVDCSWFPWDEEDPLSPYGNQLRAWRGIEYGDGFVVEFPVFTGRINSVDLQADRSVRVTCVDVAADVVDNEFEMPTQAATVSTIPLQIKELILNGYPPATFGTFDPIFDPVPMLTWDTDRGQALDDLATAGGAFWYPLPDGNFVLRAVPWARDPATVVPVVTLTDGPLGTITGAAVSTSREGVANSITARSERADGTPPLHRTVRDLDPTSPTFYPGKFGRVNRTVSMQEATTNGQLTAAAQVLLRRARARVRTWAINIVPDAAIELGDAVQINAVDHTALQCVAGFTLPLNTEGDMQVQLRSFVAGGV